MELWLQSADMQTRRLSKIIWVIQMQQHKTLKAKTKIEESGRGQDQGFKAGKGFYLSFLDLKMDKRGPQDKEYMQS